jgi:hypothetical protein
MGAGDNSNPRLNYFFIDESVDADLSEPLFKGSLDICALEFPTMTSASITFEESRTGASGTFVPVHWNGAVLQITITSGTIQHLDPMWFSGAKYLKIKTAGAEAADRSIYPIWRQF